MNGRLNSRTLQTEHYLCTEAQSTNMRNRKLNENPNTSEKLIQNQQVLVLQLQKLEILG